MGLVRESYAAAQNAYRARCAEVAAKNAAALEEQVLRVRELLSILLEDGTLLRERHVYLINPDTGCEVDASLRGNEWGLSVCQRGDLIANLGFDLERHAYHIIESNGRSLEVFEKPDTWEWYPDARGCAEGLGKLLFRYSDAE